MSASVQRCLLLICIFEPPTWIRVCLAALREREKCGTWVRVWPQGGFTNANIGEQHAKAKTKIQRLLPVSFHLRCSQKPTAKSANCYEVIDPLSQVSVLNKQSQSSAWPLLCCMMWGRKASIAPRQLSINSACQVQTNRSVFTGTFTQANTPRRTFSPATPFLLRLLRKHYVVYTTLKKWGYIRACKALVEKTYCVS